MKEVFGIDLGTTNSCVSTIGEDGLPIVIKIRMMNLPLPL